MGVELAVGGSVDPERVRTLRNGKGWSQATLAEKAGVSQAAAGAAVPSARRAAMYVRAASLWLHQPWRLNDWHEHSRPFVRLYLPGSDSEGTP